MRPITIQEVLEEKGRAIFAIEPGRSVFDALGLMADKGIGALLVMEGAELRGILSERDYARKVILAGKSSLTTAVAEIMSTKISTISPEETVANAMRMMTEGRFRHLPVLEKGRVVGMISIGDIVRTIMEEQQKTIEHLATYITGGMA